MSPRLCLAFFVDSVPFTKGVIDGTESLGGSESACVGLARALQARGHQVHLFVTKLEPGCEGHDHAGVSWHPAKDAGLISQYIEWDVFCSLRMAHYFAGDLVNARLRWLWNQDLLIGEPAVNTVMASAFQVDHILYVSDYHRKQWEGVLPCLAPMGRVVKNGYDASLVPAVAEKKPHRVIHISRPERGLGPLLQMWPAVRQAVPDAELAICRYNSMYDAGGWGQVCQWFDQQVEAVDQAVGGIVRLGELGKPALYQAIAESAVMWYPGISSFAETSCIAAIEAQACGTPFVGSWKGALPETVPSGLLFKGDAERDESYQQASVEAVIGLLRGCETGSKAYRTLQAKGRTHVTGRYSYEAIAEQWEDLIRRELEHRYQTHRQGVIDRLFHDDDPVAAMVALRPSDNGALAEYAKHIIDGKDQSAEDYADRALDDPVFESHSERFVAAADQFKGCARVLDVACGNGSFALALTRMYPEIQVHGLDYAGRNIDRARKATDETGVGDRCTFTQATVYDFETHALHEDWRAFVARCQAEGLTFDGAFVGEFLEHVANIQGLVDGIESLLQPGATVVYTMPSGPLSELMPRGWPLKRGHVHRFAQDDILGVFGAKQKLGTAYMNFGPGVTAKGRPVGHWLISYAVSDPVRPTGERPLRHRALSARPYPRLSVGLITKNAAHDLGRCLDSVWAIADEIVIGDTGSDDETKAVAETFGAKVLDLPPIEAHEQGFAGARNAVLAACTGDWFLWIDADELLIGADQLTKYIDAGGPFQGYVIRQQHLYVDLPSSFDIPVRLFRRVPEIRFYGCVHEQPAWQDANTEIYPTLELRDVSIAHTGYLTESVRRHKMLKRNLPLLQRDARVFPDRVLGKVLILRDFVNVADASREQLGHWSEEAVQWLQSSIVLFEQHFADPAHKYHGLARPWYEMAVKRLTDLGIRQGYEMEIALGGKAGGMGKAHVAPERVWVQSPAEYERIVAHKASELRKLMQTVPVDVEPMAARPELEQQMAVG